MADVTIDTSQITDEASFHQLFKEVLGFPDFYGMNMDAWIDCMLDMHTEYRMCRIQLTEGEMLHMYITNTSDFNKSHSELMKSLIECTGWVNTLVSKRGEKPYLSLVFLHK